MASEREPGAAPAISTAVVAEFADACIALGTTTRHVKAAWIVAEQAIDTFLATEETAPLLHALPTLMDACTAMNRDAETFLSALRSFDTARRLALARLPPEASL